MTGLCKGGAECHTKETLKIKECGEKHAGRGTLESNGCKHLVRLSLLLLKTGYLHFEKSCLSQEYSSRCSFNEDKDVMTVTST